MSGNVAIHRTAIVAPDVEIGDGTIVGPFAVVLAPCSIGRELLDRPARGDRHDR